MSDLASISVHPASPAEWRAWLEQHHARPGGVWLISYKQASGKPRMAYEEAVEIALCYGWIDSKPRALDAQRSMLWFAPRKKGSAWSRKNKERVERLTQDGRMHAAGLAKVEQARKDGSWTQLDLVETLTLPPDLRLAFKAHPGAQKNFVAFPRSTQRAILEWIGSAKTDTTRTKRLTQTATLAAQNIRANQWSKSPKGGAS